MECNEAVIIKALKKHFNSVEPGAFNLMSLLKFFLVFILSIITNSFSADPRNIKCLSQDDQAKLKEQLDQVVGKYDLKTLQDRYIETRTKLLEANDAYDRCESKSSVLKDLDLVKFNKQLDVFNRLLNLSKLLQD